jgi:hypothetical protein
MTPRKYFSGGIKLEENFGITDKSRTMLSIRKKLLSGALAVILSTLTAANANANEMSERHLFGLLKGKVAKHNAERSEINIITEALDSIQNNFRSGTPPHSAITDGHGMAVYALVKYTKTVGEHYGRLSRREREGRDPPRPGQIIHRRGEEFQEIFARWQANPAERIVWSLLTEEIFSREAEGTEVMVDKDPNHLWVPAGTPLPPGSVVVSKPKPSFSSTTNNFTPSSRPISESLGSSGR